MLQLWDNLQLDLLTKGKQPEFKPDNKATGFPPKYLKSDPYAHKIFSIKRNPDMFPSQ